MDEFGTVFMSTVGAGIVCGKLSAGTEPPTSTENPTTKPTTPPAEDILCGDANNDGVVSIADAAAIYQYLANPDKYTMSAQGKANADADGKSGITASDALAIQKLDAGIIKELPEKAE